MQIIKNTSSLLLTCLLILAVDTVAAQALAESFIFPAVNNKLVVWKINGVKYGVGIPSDLSVAVDQVSGKLAIGFVHSGYSAGEPDGRNALLTLSALLKNEALTSEDQQQIQQQQIIMDAGVLQAAMRYRITLTLASDTGEQTRLRTLLHFPADLTLSENYALQVKWQNVNGQVLYDYLTASSGLMLIALIDVGLTATLKTSVCFDDQKAKAWWDDNTSQSDNYIIVKGGVDPVLLDLISNKVFTACNEGSTIDPRLMTGLKKQLTGMLVRQSKGKYRLNKKDFFNAAWKNEVSDSYQADVPAIPIRLSPGSLLLKNPGYVKDLSSSEQKGLNALK